MRVQNIALVLWLCATACARLPAFSPEGESLAREDARTICQRLAAQHEQVRSARALVHATIQASGEVASFRYAIVTKQPGNMRVDLLPMEGAYTLGLLVVGRDGATLMDTTNRTFAIESDAEKLTREFIGLPGLTPDVVLALVTGKLPPMECATARVFRSGDGALMIRDENTRLVWEVDPHSTSIRGAQVLTTNGQEVEALARIHKNDGGFVTVDFSVYSPASASAEMIVRKLTVNREIPEDLFKVAIPSGYTRQ